LEVLPERKTFSPKHLTPALSPARRGRSFCAREIAKKLGPLGLTWSCNSRANLDYDTIKLGSAAASAAANQRLAD
jgi:hypothetical protein